MNHNQQRAAIGCAFLAALALPVAPGLGGHPAGSFTTGLIDLIARADPQNQAKLGLGFPGYVHAVYIAQNSETGITELRAIAAQERFT